MTGPIGEPTDGRPSPARPRPTPSPAAAPPPQAPPPLGFPPPQAYPPQGYPPAGHWGHPPGPRNDLGVAAMVCGIVGAVLGFFVIGVVPAVLGIVFGLIGRARVRRGVATNGGQALAGIVTGAVGVALFVVLVVVLVATGGDDGSGGNGFSVA